AVVLATGGLSVPQTGSDGTGLEVARELGHQVHDPFPALTPLLADPPRARAPRRGFTTGGGHCRRAPQTRDSRGGVPVHPPRLQRPGRARHLPSRGTGGPRRPNTNSPGPLEPARRGVVAAGARRGVVGHGAVPAAASPPRAPRGASARGSGN